MNQSTAGSNSLPCGDSRELDGAEFVASLLVVADDAALAAQGRVHREVGALLDQRQVAVVRGGRAAEVPALLHHRLLRADPLGELLGEPRAGVDRVQLHVTERVPADLLAAGLHLGHDRRHARTLGQEDVHAVVLVHHRLQPFGLGVQVDRCLRHVHRVHVPSLPVQPDARAPLLLRQPAAVLPGRCRGQPSAVAAHHLVDDEHPGVRAVLGDDVAGEDRPLLGGRPRTEALPDRDHVVVDGLRQPDHGQVVVVLVQVRREVGGRGVGVVAADGVQHVDAIRDEALGGHLEGVLPVRDEAALDQVGSVRQLHPAVSDRAAAELVQQPGLRPHLRRDVEVPAAEQTVVPVQVGDDLDVGRQLAVALDQPADGGRQAGREPMRR